MKLREIMSTPVLTLNQREDAGDAYVTMADAGVRHGVVIADAHVVGIVSERDLGCRRGTNARRGHTVADVMRSDPVVGSPEMSAPAAALLLREHGIGCLPILDEGRLVGIVTRSDLLLALAGRRRRERRAAPHPRRPS